MNVTVSVIMITYLHDKYIIDAINGVINQRCDFNVELIIADDNSPDQTKTVVDNFLKEFNLPTNIKVTYKKHTVNKGVNVNYLWAANRSKGKYIANCEGDDYWTDPLKLQKQVDFLQENDGYVGVFHNTAFIDERQPNSKLKPWRTYTQDVFTAQDTIRKLSLFHTSSYCFRNLEFDLEYLLIKHLISADMMLLGLISKFGKLKLIDETMSVYRKNEGGVTSSESKIKYHRNRIALNKALNKYFDNKYQEHANKILMYHKNELFKIKYPSLYKFYKKLTPIV